MTRRRRSLLVVLVALLLGGGGFAWYWQATAVDRRVDALLDELREEEPSGAQGWLISLGLVKDRRTDRGFHDVGVDLAELGPSAVPALNRALGDEDVWVRLATVWALHRLEAPCGIEPLIPILKSENPYVRFCAVKVLGWMGDAPHTIELLHASLKDEDAQVRGMAVGILRVRKDTRSVEPLIAALNDEDSDVCRAAARALGRLGDARAVEPLIAVLGKYRESWMMSCTVARALGELGDVRAIEPLEELLEGEDETVHRAAKGAIEKLRARESAP